MTPNFWTVVYVYIYIYIYPFFYFSVLLCLKLKGPIDITAVPNGLQWSSAWRKSLKISLKMSGAYWIPLPSVDMLCAFLSTRLFDHEMSSSSASFSIFAHDLVERFKAEVVFIGQREHPPPPPPPPPPQSCPELSCDVATALWCTYCTALHVVHTLPGNIT